MNSNTHIPISPLPGSAFRVPRSEFRVGFTLIELLVVVTIIVLMLAMLMPSLSSAVRAAQVAGCMSNLKQYGYGVMSYEMDNLTAVPPIGERWWTQSLIASPVGGGRGYNVLGILARYENIPVDKLVCPADSQVLDTTDGRLWMPGTTEVNTAWTDAHRTSYSVMQINYNVAGRHVPWSVASVAGPYLTQAGASKLSNIPRPSSMYLLADGPFFAITQQFDISVSQVAMLDLTNTGWAASWQHIWRHNPNYATNLYKGPNAWLADGHVEPTIDFFKLTNDNVSYAR